MRKRHLEADEHDESYFMSMTDMMVGVLFIFIIMLMAFALNLQKETDRLSGAKKARTELINELKERLDEEGVEVSIEDIDQGLLRLPDQILFPRGSAELKQEGLAKVNTLSKVLMEVLPCYLPENNNYACKKEMSLHKLEAVFIEGHTDKRPYTGRIGYDNWNLSSDRSINTYRHMVESSPLLADLINPQNKKILSVSGYAHTRPENEGESEEDLQQNRRIALRFIMATPGLDKLPEPAEETKEQIQENSEL